MKQEKSISFFIPAYNEEENLKAITEEIKNFLSKNFKRYEIIIVANKSKDNTQKVARQLEKKYGLVRAILQKKFVGYGTQLKTGWENSKHDLIFYTDSDRQFDISELKNFLQYMGEYDIVIGYRKKRQDPIMRVIYSKLYNLALCMLLGIRVKDADCAFKLCKKKVIDKIRPITQDRGSDAEFLVKARAANFKIKELPVTHRPRMVGVSEAEVNPKSFFIVIKPEIVMALIKEALYLRRFRR